MPLGLLRRAFSSVTAVSAARTMGPVQESIERKLTEGLKPTHLVIKNDSHKHAGHADMPAGAGEDSETHFRVEITSAAFEGRTPLQRHRMVYEMLAQELEEGVHALSVKALTPGTS